MHNKLNNATALIVGSQVFYSYSATTRSGSSVRSRKTTKDAVDDTVPQRPAAPPESVQSSLRLVPVEFPSDSSHIDHLQEFPQQARFHTSPTGYFVDDATLRLCTSFSVLRFSGPQSRSIVNPSLDVNRVLRAIMLPSSQANNTRAGAAVEQPLISANDAMDVDSAPDPSV